MASIIIYSALGYSAYCYTALLAIIPRAYGARPASSEFPDGARHSFQRRMDGASSANPWAPAALSNSP